MMHLTLRSLKRGTRAVNMKVARALLTNPAPPFLP
jgi:hypothetical protein